MFFTSDISIHTVSFFVNSQAAGATGIGTAVLRLQSELPLARLIYASATAATELQNMAYLTRLGLWGQGTLHH